MMLCSSGGSNQCAIVDPDGHRWLDERRRTCQKIGAGGNPPPCLGSHANGRDTTYSDFVSGVVGAGIRTGVGLRGGFVTVMNFSVRGPVHMARDTTCPGGCARGWSMMAAVHEQLHASKHLMHRVQSMKSLIAWFPVDAAEPCWLVSNSKTPATAGADSQQPPQPPGRSVLT
jgi:hypothetical protein